MFGWNVKLIIVTIIIPKYFILIKFIDGTCYAGFSPAVNASMCYMFISTTRTYWSADYDCKIQTGYEGVLAEIRDVPQREFLLYQMISLLLFLVFLKTHDETTQKERNYKIYHSFSRPNPVRVLQKFHRGEFKISQNLSYWKCQTYTLISGVYVL